ncbi:MAG: alpha/beta hydrolase [Actinobacteria bacterium]|nr:alpha/beta hydrolase [Actinomycetota bacterium]
MSPAPRPTLRLAVVLVTAALALTACQRPDPRADGPTAPTRAATSAGAPTPVTYPYEQIAGVDPDLLSLDVYAPAGAVPAGGRAALVWVHGGAWQTGDKANDTMATKAAWAAQHDHVLISVNYRLATDGPTWPEPAQDVAAALDWVLARTDQLGIDPARVALLGHSAGAHLAAEVLADPAYLAAHTRQRTDLACLVTLDAASYDLTAPDPGIARMVSTAFGDDPATLAQASPTLRLQSVGGPVPATLVVTRGVSARVADATSYAHAVTAAGPHPATLVDAPDASHQDLNDLLGAPGDQVVTPAVDTFLAGCLG